MAVLQDININVHGQPSEKRLQTFLRLSQNENGRMINFRVLGPPLPSGCTATFSGTKPDGNVYSKTGTVAGNFVVIQEDMQMTAVAGVWDAKLDIINGSHNIMTALIRVVVDADVVDPDAIASDSQLQGIVAEAKYYAEHARTDAYGSPLTAPTKAQMTDHTRVYVYTGSEPNMTAGNWYHWNGTAWISGGVYNSVAVQSDSELNDFSTNPVQNKVIKAALDQIEGAIPEIDATLSVAGKAADAKKTGDEISSLKEDLNAVSETRENKIDESELLKCKGCTVSGGVYSAVLNDIVNGVGTSVGGFSVRHPFKPNTGYTLTGYFKNTGSVTEGNGPRINFNYTDGTQDHAALPNVSRRRLVTYASDAEKTLDFVSFGLSSVAAKNNVWEIDSLMLQETKSPLDSYIPYGITAKDDIARGMVNAADARIDATQEFLKLSDGYTVTEFTLTSGHFIRYDTGVVAESGQMAYTDYIEVGLAKRIKYARVCKTQSTGVVGMAFYDADKTFISGQRMLIKAAFDGYVDTEIDVPDNAVYARFSAWDDTSTYGDLYVKLENAIATRCNTIEQTISPNVKAYNLFKSGYINTSGDTVNIDSPVSNDDFMHIVIQCDAGDVFMPNIKGGGASRLRVVFCDEDGSVLYKSTTSSESASANPFTYNPYVKYIAPTNTVYAVFNHQITTAGFSPTVYKGYSDDVVNYQAAKDGQMPYMPTGGESWRRKVIATYNSFIAIKDGNNIRISDDCGKTWTDDIDASGVDSINNTHIFADGTLAFFTDTKAYYVEDGTVQEADVYEADGVTPFVLDGDSNFNATRDYAERKFLSGSGNNDMYVFHNYHMLAGTGRPIVWYTIDKGRTYKVAYEFNLEDTPTVRHIHAVLYWATHDVFIVTTGDKNATECHVCALTYDTTNDAWEFEHLAGSARDYKWAGMALWNDELYYTHDSTPGSLWKTTYENIPDLSKHVCLLDYTEDDANNVWFGANGDCVVCQSTARSTAGATVPSPFTPYEACRKIFYSSNRKTFEEIFLPNQFNNKSSIMSCPKPITSDGHYYIGTSNGIDKLPSVCVDDYVRLAGYKQAFKQRI